MESMDFNSFSTPLPNGITIRHLELHNLSVREARPIIEFEYDDSQEHQINLTIFGNERPGLLADLTDYLESTALHVRQASIYSLPSNAIMDQFTLHDPQNILEDDDTLRQIHDTLVHLIGPDGARLSRRRPPPGRLPRSISLAASPSERSIIPSSPHSKDSLYNYALLGHRVPISLLAPRVTTRTNVARRISSNLALRDLEEQHRLEFEAARRKSEAVTADFVEDAISSLVDGDFLYHYSSQTRYRHRFSLSEDRTHLCWGDSQAIRLSRFAGVLFGPKSSVFQDLGSTLVDPEWLCFSLVSNPAMSARYPEDGVSPHPNTIDLVCVSVDQLNRWLLGLQSLCRPNNTQLLHHLTLDDITRKRLVYKIRAHAHARGLTVRRYVLKRVEEAGRKRSSFDANGQNADEVRQLEAELARLQKSLIDYARRETLLNTSLRDFQTSWEIDFATIQFLHPIGQGAFSEMWKGIWRSTPVAVKRLTTRTLTEATAAPLESSSRSGSSKPSDELALERMERLEGANISPEDRRLLHDFRLEVTMLNKLRHPNVVFFLGACTVLPNMCILTEFCHGGSLFTALRKRSWRTSLSLQDLRSAARHIARGVNYLHAMHIIHRDLKSQNLLLDRPVEDGCPVVKVADFGLSRNFSGIGTVTGSVAGIMTSETGTYRWMAPEMIRHEPYNEKVDVYSFGVVLWELFSCEVPFAGMTPIQAAFAVADKHLRPKCESEYAKGVKIPAAWQALIGKCWHKDSHSRPRFPELLRILDEMENCADGEVPPLLKGKRDAGQGQDRGGRPNGNVASITKMPSGGLLASSDEDGFLESVDALRMNNAASSSKISAQTGLGRSGSSPALSRMN